MEFAAFKARFSKQARNDEFRLLVESCSNNTIPDSLFYQCDDSAAGYLREMEVHSRKKHFFKALQDAKTLDRSHIPMLASFTTHLSLGYAERVKNRGEVRYDSFVTLKHQIDKIIDDLVAHGETHRSHDFLFVKETI